MPGVTPLVKNRQPTAATYRMEKASGSDAAEIFVYDFIGSGGWMGGGISADTFAKDLRALGPVKTIGLRINSDGGDVFDAKAMYSLLVAHPANIVVHVDGIAASAASFLAMAGNEIRIAEGGFMMIHDAYGGTLGNADDHRKMADLLDSVTGTIAEVYAARSGTPVDEIRGLMAVETWMSGKDAIDKGFADVLVENRGKVAARLREPRMFRNLPRSLQPNRAALADRIAALRRAS
jgi:ATP-dependent protease ClpP protease subunit